MTKTPQPRRARRRLLAVDDNRLILRVIKDHFVHEGWDVTTAENVAAARDALTGFTPDVIVSDILMPGIDGWAFFEEVRNRKQTSSVPFVFLTVERKLPQRLRGLQLGADDYMTKPFAVEELHARIERLLERSAALKRAHCGGTEALLAGSAEHLSIPDLLQILSLNRKDGTLRLQRADEEGRIEFAGGRVVDAETGSAHGTKALFRMLGWTDATFRVTAREGRPHEQTIDAPTSHVLMEGLVALDDWNRWRELMPSLGTRLEATQDVVEFLDRHAARQVEIDLLERARDGILVSRAIEESPYPDADVAEAICTLLARGAVRAVQEEAETGAAQKR